MRILSEKPCSFCGSPILVPSGSTYCIQCRNCSEFNINPPPESQRQTKHDPRTREAGIPQKKVIDPAKTGLWTSRNTKRQLLKLASEQGLSIKSSLSKRQVMKALEEAGYLSGD